MSVSDRLEGVLLRIPESNWLEQVLRVPPPSYRLAAWEHLRMLHRKVSK